MFAIPRAAPKAYGWDRDHNAPVFELTAIQDAAAGASGSSFLLGPAGTGKSRALQERLLRLLAGGEPAYTILVLVAELQHRHLFEDAVMSSKLGPFTDLKVTTYSHMALEMVTLFWPLIARQSGFAQPHQPPTILTYDLAQLLMWQVATPILEGGAFADLRLRPQQIVSQVLDTLNRSALNSLTLDQAAERQINSWSGEKARLQHLHDASLIAKDFRDICLQKSLLDLSLSIEVFDTQLVHNREFHRYFTERYRHLIVDNVEEQTPAGQNFIASLMDLTQTTTIAYDEEGGFKRFMSADPLSARQFQHRCQSFFQFSDSFAAPPEMAHLSNLVENYLQHSAKPTDGADDMLIDVASGRYRREMVLNLVQRLSQLIADGVPAGEIAIITPYLDGALRYSLTQELSRAKLPYRLLRRRSSPREEPRIRAWLTWLMLAHPQWNLLPSAYDVAEALSVSIQDLDPARAGLAVKYLYSPNTGILLPLEQMPEKIQERIGLEFLERCEELRLWLANIPSNMALDQFLHDLFTQVLSQRRFQPEPDVVGAAVCDWLVRTATRLREAALPMGLQSSKQIGLTFIDGINQGLVSANPPDLGEPPDPDGIMISTIYGYLLEGQAMRVQVWLETAATGWWDIPKQPLSNAFVLTQSYEPNTAWTMTEDFAIRNELLSRIIRGLCGRCSDGIILANSELDRRGIFQEGPLWRALQPVIRVKAGKQAA